MSARTGGDAFGPHSAIAVAPSGCVPSLLGARAGGRFRWLGPEPVVAAPWRVATALSALVR